MPAAVSLMTTNVQVGKVEDVSDVISMISPTNTPFLTMAGSEDIHNTLAQWQEDTLDAPAQNAQVEGADAPPANMEPPLMRHNGTQIFGKTVSVSGSAMKIKLHGPKEWARQMAKKGKEIKRDLEYAIVGTSQVQTAAAGGTGALFAGAQAQFDASCTFAQGTVVLSEAAILGAAQHAYDIGGDPDKLLCSSANATVIADFALSSGPARIRDLGAMKKLVNCVDVYVTPFGIELTVVIDRWMNQSNVMLLDFSMWKLLTFRGWFTKPLAETGDSKQSELLGEFSLKHRNYFGEALLTGLASPIAGTNHT